MLFVFADINRFPFPFEHAFLRMLYGAPDDFTSFRIKKFVCSGIRNGPPSSAGPDTYWTATVLFRRRRQTDCVPVLGNALACIDLVTYYDSYENQSFFLSFLLKILAHQALAASMVVTLSTAQSKVISCGCSQKM